MTQQQPRSQVSYLWQQPEVHKPYRTGVSLHSHTSLSVETLTFVHEFCTRVPMVGRMVAWYDGQSRANRGIKLDFDAGNWRPPLVPRMAWELESGQIEQLGLRALVSITDHDSMEAPLLLRTVPAARHIPVSLEWSAPFGRTSFHLGVHNLPSAEAATWMERLAAFTAAPDEAELAVLLAELDALPQVLLVLNHPEWDLYKIGEEEHRRELHRFMAQHNRRIHALELNGLRHARENREVLRLARRWNQLLISGGDRHGLEANANINLTNAETFTDFVREIREERRSHVLFLPQYNRPWQHRIMASTLDAVCDHAHFSEGWQRWDQRAFHPDAQGNLRPLAELWPDGQAPLPLRLAIRGVRLLRHRPVARTLGLALSHMGPHRGGLLEGSAAETA